ncbi:MAG TPA: DNA polymerase III subunit chi [Burkholderiales bacterium]|nr:DNA polymerase III subunit chi [Burkholderiales bacterium]
MTKIDFYTYVSNKHQMVATLAGKALTRGVRMAILTPDAPSTEQLDKLLWMVPPIGFLPHCRAHHRLAPVTPIIIDHVTEPVVHEEVLLNLCASCPPHFSRFERLIEIVTSEDEDRAQARERFRFYRERGYEIRTHDLRAAQS